MRVLVFRCSHSEEEAGVSRSRVRFISARLGAVLTACLAGLLIACAALPGEAAATTRPTPSTPGPSLPQLIRPLLPASSAVTTKTVTAGYACDFSAYGSGIAPSTVSASTVLTITWPVNQPDAIVMSIDKITLPSAVTSMLTGVDSITVASQVTAKQATEATIPLIGQVSVNASSAPTEIPATVAAGQVTFPAKGTDGSVALPAQSITFTPKAGTTAKPVITCTTTTPASDVTVTVGDASGPFYHCAITSAGGGGTQDVAFPLAWAITETGTKQAGDTLTMSVGSADVASLISSAASSAAGAGVTLDKATFSADLAVTGAQSATLHLTKTVTDLTSASFSASAKLKLTKAGTVKVDFPSKFSIGLFASGTDSLDIACLLVTKPAPVALTLVVVVAPSPSPSASETSGGDADDTSATPEATGTPEGGAATGGGLTPGGDMPLAIGGAALALIGGGLLLARVTVPRRRKAAPPENAQDGTSGAI
jgi:hypothetical protein